MNVKRNAPALLTVLVVLGGVGSLLQRAALGPAATSASQIMMAGGAVGSLAWSPDVKLLAAGVAIPAVGADGSAGRTHHEVQLWDAETNDQKRALQGHAALVAGLQFRADGRVLATGSRAEVNLWDTGSGAPLRAFTGRHRRVPPLLAFAAEGRLAATTGGGNVEVWDLQAGALRWREDRPTFPGLSDPVLSAAFSPDGKQLAIGSEAGVSLWELPGSGPAPRLYGQSKRCGSGRVLAFSPDGTLLASGSAGGAVAIWDVRSSQTFAKVPLLLRAHSRSVDALAFSADGRLLASAGRRPPGEGDGGEIRVWELPAGKLRQRLEGHEGPVTAIAWRPDGRTLASGGDDGTIRLWPAP